MTGAAAVVTGAGQGLGEAIAATFAAAGRPVVLSDLDAERVEAAAAAIRAAGGVAVGVRGDPDRPGKSVSAHGSTSSIPREGQAPTIEHGLIAQASDAAGEWISPRFHPGHLAVPKVP